MSLTAAVIDAMVAAGCTAEQLGAAMKASLAEQEAKRESRREGNAARQRKFKAKRRGNAGNALPSVTPPIEEIIPPVSSDEETRPVRKSKAGTVAKPAGVADPVWRDFTRQRKTPVSETALDGIEQEARKAGWSLNAALAEAVARGWQSFKAEWVESSPSKPPGGPANDFLDSILGKQAAAP